MCCLLVSSYLSLNKCFEFEFNKNLLFSKVVFFKCCLDGKGGGGGGGRLLEMALLMEGIRYIDEEFESDNDLEDYENESDFEDEITHSVDSD